MTNFEKLKSMTEQEVAEQLCNLVSEVMYRADREDCKYCPAQHLCGKGHNGFRALLAQEAEETKDAQKV